MLKLIEIEDIGKIFINGFIKPNYARYQRRESDWREGLKLFLSGGAFERQGRSPNYCPVAIDSINTKCKDKKCITKNDNLHKEIWDFFKKNLPEDNKKDPANIRNNPLSPKGTPYYKNKKSKTREGKTNKVSIIEFIKKSECLQNYDYNITLFIREEIKKNKVYWLYQELKKINGIGGKIASLFMRDVAVYYNIPLDNIKNRELLQPVDVWVRRFFYQLYENTQDLKRFKIKKPQISSDKNNNNYAKFIVDKCVNNSISPEKVNMGMWYSATQICGSSYYVLNRFIKDKKFRYEKLNEHVNFLNKTHLAVKNHIKKYCYQRLVEYGKNS